MEESIEIQLFELVGDLSRKMHRRIDRETRADQLSATEVSVLWRMSRKRSCRVSELASEIGLPASTLTGILDRLVGRGILARETDPNDRRSVIITTTSKVDEFVNNRRAASRAIVFDILKQFTPDEMERMLAGLKRFNKYMDESEAEEDGR
jgi:MarR family transcriptional regulator for hemolysin